MAYTDAQVAALKAVQGLDYEKAKAFAEEHGLTARSVIAKAKALDLPYKSKVGTNAKPKKVAVRRKADVATSVNELLDVELASLDKLTLADLEALEARVKEMVGE